MVVVFTFHTMGKRESKAKHEIHYSILIKYYKLQMSPVELAFTIYNYVQLGWESGIYVYIYYASILIHAHMQICVCIEQGIIIIYYIVKWLGKTILISTNTAWARAH